MPSYYLDIETTGLDPTKNKIITIQFQELERGTGKPIGELVILKEWESNESNILKTFAEKSGILDPYPFSFVPVGYNLNFEHNFLLERTRQHGLQPIDVLNHPFLDLRTIGILMKRGEFKGSGLDQITRKEMNGSKIPEWYQEKEYEKIISYVQQETKSFNEFNEWLHQRMPSLLEEFQSKFQ